MTNVHQILSDTDPLLALLSRAQEQFVGYAFDIDYGELSFLTNDLWKERVRGIPHNAFLLASALNAAHGLGEELDREVLLLRVLAPTPLPQAGELIRTRIEHHQRRTRAQQLPERRPGETGDERGDQDGFDWLTRSELQSSALRCRIIGTFYMDGDELRLGSDIENYMAMSPLRIYRPSAEALETIVNHVNAEVRAKSEQEARAAGFTRAPSPIVIGTIRYTSTRRLQNETVEVRIAPSDFLARRTAILGMTRTGKSNTVKTTVAAVTLAALQDGVPVGQLIFDLNGEYANANHQDDGSSIADVFPDQTVRYRADDTSGFEDLRVNFYEDPAGALQLMGQLYRDETIKLSTAQDIVQLFDLDLHEPDRDADPPGPDGVHTNGGEDSEQETEEEVEVRVGISAHTRWKNHSSAFLTLLYASEIPGAPSSFEIPVTQSVLDQIGQAGVEIPSALLSRLRAAPTRLGGTRIPVSPQDAVAFWTAVRQANLRWRDSGTAGARRGRQAAGADFSGNGTGLLSSSGRPWVDKTLEVLLNTLASENSRGTPFVGVRAVKRYAPYHSRRRQSHLQDDVISHLRDGKIVILDLSVGPVSIRKVLAERIARHVFDEQMKVLHRGQTPQNIVIYVEEAHNLIGKQANLDTTWPRLAKEGAKARIAFVYATQEPSSVHPNVLANTENWFVTHLNNDDELKALAKFYDFADFTPSLKIAQDVGFARIKTLSSPFVTPVQILRFTPEELIAKRLTFAQRSTITPPSGLT